MKQSESTVDEKVMTKLYSARWVLPIASPPVEDGAVAVEGSRIAAVGTLDELVALFPEAPVRDFGEAAILPGFVNAHSHLELTAMRGYLEREEGDFFAWLKKLTIARLERMTTDDLYVSAAWGAVEAARAGVTCVGDASDAASASMRALGSVGLRGTVYQESFGPDPAEARENFEKLREKVERLREYETELVRVGVSPHAPYSVSAPQLELITEFALAEKLSLMMHAAESKAETLFMLQGSGPFAENLAGRGIKWRAPGISTVQYLARHGLLRAKPLLAHCIRVDDADIETIKEACASIAHCPKSNAKLGHGRAPFASFVKREVKVGFGSDSVASNNTCDILEEARFAILTARASENAGDSTQMPGAEIALQTSTLGGSDALGLESQTGALLKGTQADIAVVNLSGAHQTPAFNPVTALIFASSGRDVLMTIVAGREVYSDGHVHTVDEEHLRARMLEIRDKLS
ncbi:MAG: 5-methylthioadenosine/S-adenosylhomocysteine deaminase [Acidobacteriota bacterium]|nr:5-methylthioadenosine/S-adenosylhomocysteine deaminase [Acidobacteriota bacterium]